MRTILTCVTALLGGAAVLCEGRAEPLQTVATAAPAEEEEIVVLRERAGATKIDAPVRDLPQAISTIQRDILEDREIVRLEEIADATVGIRPTLPFVGGVSLGFFVRGFNGAPILVDGVNAGVTAGDTATVQNLALAERIEILRGPASVLYGQGNPGGVVNIVLKRPEERFGWAVDGAWDSFGARRVNADVTGGLGVKGLSGRLIANFEDSETFRDFGVVRRLAAAPQIDWRFDPRTRLEVRYAYDDYTFNADRGFGFDGTLLSLGIPERNLAEPTLGLTTIVSQTLRSKLSRDIAEGWMASLDFSGYRYKTPRSQQIDLVGTVPGTLQVQRFLTIYGEPEDNSQQDWTVSGSLQGEAPFLGLSHRIFASAERVESFNNFAGVFDVIPPIDALAPVYSPTPLTLSVEEPFEGAFQSRTTAVYLQDLISIGEQWKLLVGGAVRFHSDRILRRCRAHRGEHGAARHGFHATRRDCVAARRQDQPLRFL